MSVIVNKNTRVVVQGITGNEGHFHTTSMLGYGTPIVAGVTPGKGGQIVEGIPVFETVKEAVNKQNVNTSIIFVPAPYAGNAVNESIDAGIKTVIVITEAIPQRDSIRFIARAKEKGITVIGPNTAGVLNPALKIHIGVMPAHIFKPGIVGIASRSGTLSYEIAWHISNSGLGQSTCVGIGGDPIIGLDSVSVLDMFRNDEETKGVVLIGEIGGSMEQSAARYIKETKYPKPVVAYIAGRLAPPEKHMGHAGAIISGTSGTAKSKVETYAACGVPVAEKPSDIPRMLGLA